MKRCATCAAVLPEKPDRAAYVRVVEGVIVAVRDFPICACCVARSTTNPRAVTAALSTAFNRGMN